jgi:glycosyltransferase involved in cell wall biosynthesis
VIHIARLFAEAGWRVDVYNSPDYYEGVHDGVGYWGPERLRPGESCDVLVSWRQPAAIDLPVNARMRLLWLHDLNAGPDAGPQMRRFDRVCGVSQWHADYLREQYDLDPATVGFVPNGIDLARFTETKKVFGRCVYASSPDRGLDRLLSLWPRIKGREDAPELHIGYGFENIDKRIAAGDQGYAAFKANLMRLIEKTPGVVFHGRLGQQDLAQLYSESWAWLYPTSFLEVSCISSMEAMAGGCVPVCSSVGALKETVGKGGYVVPGLPESKAWPDFYVNVARGVLYEMNTHKAGELAARAQAQQFSWANAFTKWQSVIAGCLEPQKESACSATF